MDKNTLISKYKLHNFHYDTIHSAGPDIFFKNPCIGYIKKGHAKFLYNGKTIYAYRGDLIYIAYETRYQSIWYGSPDIEWYSIDFDFNSKYAFYEFRFQILRNYPSGLFEKMYKNYKTSPMLSISYFYRLLDNIYSKLKATTTVTSLPIIEPAIKYIEENYQKSFPIKFLAELCHISESGFFKLFKAVTGVTPVTYKHNIMIQHAIDMISNTSLPIEEISGLVGFSSSNYFRKVFADMTGATPKQLRKN